MFNSLSYNPIQIDALGQVLDRYHGQPHQAIITDFEQQLSNLLSGRNVVALNSGTSALHLALKALGVGPGDYVVAPTFTYVATINPILYLGATPIFIDSEKETWNMDPEQLQVALEDSIRLNRKVKAAIVVHTYGMPAPLKKIMPLLEQYEIPLIEDAAESLGSTIEGQQTGTFGSIGVLSFNNNKIVTTYGGGAIVTEDDKIASQIRWWASQARDPLPYYEHREVGYNYNMGPLNAANGLIQLPNLKKYITARRELWQTYKTLRPDWVYQVELGGFQSNVWLAAALMSSSAERDEIQKRLDQLGWETRRLWRPMHRQPAFEKYPFYGQNVSNFLFEHGLCLPTGSNLDEGLKSRKLIDIVRSKVTII